MKNIIIYEPLKNAKRIKILIPYEYKDIRQKFKLINSTYWHHNQKLWSITNNSENMQSIKELFGRLYTIKKTRYIKQYQR